MDINLEGLGILLFAMIPGVPALAIYSYFYGEDWRDTEWEKLVKVICFSLFGLLLYILLREFIKLPSPIHVFPSTFDTKELGEDKLWPIARSYLLHIFFSAVIAMAYAWANRFVLSRFVKTTPHPSAWDDFVRTEAEKHWVVVGLENGESYAGYIKYADLSAAKEERDIVLQEPAKHDKEQNNYKVLGYNNIYLPASEISTIATVYEPHKDQRFTEIGGILFEGGPGNA